ncbi:MAG: FAD-binding oxidoreductase [Chitinophagales bacterium]
MKYIFRLAQTPEEADKAHKLVRATYKTAGYIKGDLNRLDAIYILCCQEEDNKLVGTACIIPSYQQFNFEELYQQKLEPFLHNKMNRSNTIEVGRFAKEESLYSKKQADIIFMGLQISVCEYMEMHNKKGWIAIGKPHLLSSLHSVGYQFETYDVFPKNVKALTEISASYFDPLDMPKLTVCTYQQIFDVVDKYHKMFVSKKICKFYIKEAQEVSVKPIPALSFLKGSKLNQEYTISKRNRYGSGNGYGKTNGYDFSENLLVKKTNFTERITKILGIENCRFSETNISYDTENVAAINKKIKGIVFPNNREEVQQIVKLANQYRIPLYPISTGKNWGLGSKLPVEDGALVVSLAKMNKIIEVNEQHGYAIIEPGVTQGQLYKHLQDKNLPFIFNVTGSGLGTSLIGNALDRGVGYFSSRVENLTGMEVVLGNGKIVKTGFGHYEQAQTTHLYPHGVGPSIDGLFFQSNYGIVVKAGFELIHKRAVHGAILCGLENEELLPQFIEDLAKLRRLGILQTAIHIANQERGRIALIPHVMDILMKQQNLSKDKARIAATKLFEAEMKNTWSAIGGVMGTDGHVQESFLQLKKHLSKYGKVTLVTKPKLQKIKKICQALSFLPFFERKGLVVNALEKAFSLSLGIPSDMALKSVYYPIQVTPKNESDPDHSDAGLLFSLPIIPMEGLAVLKANALIMATFKKWGFTAYITLNMINAKSLEGVINLAFNKKDKQRLADANACIEELNNLFMNEGYILYRTAINQMEQVVSEDDEFWQLIKGLKGVLDPKNIIAPKRYSLV